MARTEQRMRVTKCVLVQCEQVSQLLGGEGHSVARRLRVDYNATQTLLSDLRENRTLIVSTPISDSLDVALWRHDSFSILYYLSLVDLLFDWAGCEQTIDVDSPALSVPPHSRHSLDTGHHIQSKAWKHQGRRSGMICFVNRSIPAGHWPDSSRCQRGLSVTHQSNSSQHRRPWNSAKKPLKHRHDTRTYIIIFLYSHWRFKYSSKDQTPCSAHVLCCSCCWTSRLVPVACRWVSCRPGAGRGSPWTCTESPARSASAPHRDTCM